MARQAAMHVTICAAWFAAFLIPATSRELLIEQHGDWSTRGAFIIVVLVATAAGRHLLTLRNHALVVLMLGVTAPIAGFLVFLLGPALIERGFSFSDLDTRELPVIGGLILYYVKECWYVIGILGPLTAFILSRSCPRHQGSDGNDVVDAPDALAAESHQPI